ncbi:MAG: hypothetical protein ACK5TN_00495 [Acidobacteriota bacterium]
MIDLAEIWLTLSLLDATTAPRLLDADVQASVRERVERSCKALRQSPEAHLELVWGGEVSAALLAAQPSASDSKQFYVAWLKDRYDYNIARLNAAYGLDSTSFSDLAELDFRQLDRSRPAVREDDALFLNLIASMTLDRVRSLLQSCAAGRKVAWKRSPR